MFTDVDDVVIDPCAGSGSTLIAAASMDRKAYGFEIKKNFYTDACNNLSTYIQHDMFSTSKSRSYYTHKQVLQSVQQELSLV